MLQRYTAVQLLYDLKEYRILKIWHQTQTPHCLFLLSVPWCCFPLSLTIRGAPGLSVPRCSQCYCWGGSRPSVVWVSTHPSCELADYRQQTAVQGENVKRRLLVKKERKMCTIKKKKKIKIMICRGQVCTFRDWTLHEIFYECSKCAFVGWTHIQYTHTAQ